MAAYLMPQGKQQYFSTAGTPLVGGKVWTYLAGSSTPAATYTDAGGLTSNTNPVILDSRGEASIFFDSATTYKIALQDSTGAAIWTQDNLVANPVNALYASTGSSLVGYLPSGTGAVASTVQTKLRESVSDADFSTLQAAVTAAAGKRLNVYGSWTVTAAVTIASNTEIVLASSALVTTATADISVFSATNATNIRISGPGSITKTGTGALAYVGLILFENCTHSTVENVNFAGMQWSGVLLSNSSYCTVRNNHFSGSLGTVQDSADIHVFRTSTKNVIDGNFCYGSGYTGIFIQDPGTSLIPSRNVVCNNRIGAHSAYGILQYNIDISDAFTEIIGNFIEGITGTSISGTSGAGIYVNNSGGVSVIGNTIYNCCISTSSATLTPAGIGINNLSVGLSPCVVSGNSITDIVNYYGIEVASSVGGVSITGNTIRLINNTSANTNGVYLNSASNCSVVGNTIILATSTNTAGVFIYANGISVSGNVVSGNAIIGGGYAGIRVLQTASFTISFSSISNNTVSNCGASCIPYRLDNFNDGTFTGNSGNSSVNCLTITNCLRTRLANNSLTTSGALSVVTSGTCTGSYFDKSNYVGAAYTFIQNAATGLIVELLGSAVPATSNWAVGDRVEQSVPVVGNPKGWRCTVAGVPGTWVSEGNL